MALAHPTHKRHPREGGGPGYRAARAMLAADRSRGCVPSQRCAYLCCEVSWVPAYAGMTSDGATRAPYPPASPPRRVEDAPPARRRGPRLPGRTGHIPRRARPRPRAAFQRRAHLCCEESCLPAYAGMTSDEATRAPYPRPSPPRRVEDAGMTSGRMGRSNTRTTVTPAKAGAQVTGPHGQCSPQIAPVAACHLNGARTSVAKCPGFPPARE